MTGSGDPIGVYGAHPGIGATILHGGILTTAGWCMTTGITSTVFTTIIPIAVTVIVLSPCTVIAT